MVSALNSRSSGPDSNPGLARAIAFRPSGQNPNLAVSLTSGI